MKAATLTGPGRLEVLTGVDVPVVGPRDVKIALAYCGVCGSDLHAYFDPDGSGATVPQILGHEYSGTVTEVGAEVVDLQIGDRVTALPVFHCGTCDACRRGLVNICAHVAFQGLNAPGGGMADFVVIDRENVFRLPESVDLRLGALVEPMAVAWHAVKLAQVNQGERILIVGAGPIGLGVWLALRAHGVRDVIISDPSENRRAAARRMGVPLVVDPTTEDLPAIVRGTFADSGAHVVFDAAGIGAVLAQAIPLLAARGRVCIVALHEKPIQLESLQLLVHEANLMASLSYVPSDFDDVIHAMSDGLYDDIDWVDEFPLDDIVPTLERLRTGVGVKALAHLS
jgi:(R,R)-butanediol dehydrogenase / meso-butanediol dehydrogenase / diacetyl reductase